MLQSKVFCVGLDSADHRLVKEWMEAGHLPNLKKNMTAGLHGSLAGKPGSAKHHLGYTAETPCTTYLTGCWPSTTGYWSPAKFRPDYEIDEIQAYDFEDYNLFYDFCKGRKVVVFDVPHARLTDKIDGDQVIAWGAHSPQAPSGSLPHRLLDDINKDFGAHPTLDDDDLLVHQSDTRSEPLKKDFITGIERRTDIVLDMMRTRPWDLFLTSYGEPHTIGHGFWHLSEDDHPLYDVYGDPGRNPMLDVYKAIDKALGRISDALPEDAYLLVYSPQGMKANSADLPSWLFLPEILYRHSFPGKAALALGDADTPLPELKKYRDVEWVRSLWRLRETRDPIARFLQKHTRMRISYWYDRLFGKGDRLRHPLSIPAYMYMPQMWYQPYWKNMTAFALPSFSEGNVRLNVAGRERHGVVRDEAFRAVGDEIVKIVSELTDGRTGEKLVREVIRTRYAPDENPTGPDADIIFLWNEHPADVAESPLYGRIGPGIFRRSGDHHDEGFFSLKGPGIRPGLSPTYELVDLAPTILDLLGVPKPNHFDGRSMFTEIMEPTKAAQ